MESGLFIRSVYQGSQMIGIAPLRVRENEASFIGDTDVCDYQDFIIASGKKAPFFEALLDYLIHHEAVSRLRLEALRPDSSVMTHLKASAGRFGREVICTPREVSLELDLPDSWDRFLALLAGKQRHEVRRKLRRLNRAGQVRFRVVASAEQVRNQMKTFLTLFESNRIDKAAFMNAPMRRYFQTLSDEMAEAGMVKLCFLDMDARPVAATLCFDYRSTRYLYNSGYDRRYRSLSVGAVCKILSIKDAIETGKKKFDFLKGSEPYKHRMGGKPVPLYRCILDLSKCR